MLDVCRIGENERDQHDTQPLVRMLGLLFCHQTPLQGTQVNLQPPVRVQCWRQTSLLPYCCCQGLHHPARILEFRVLQSLSRLLLTVRWSMSSTHRELLQSGKSTRFLG